MRVDDDWLISRVTYYRQARSGDPAAEFPFKFQTSIPPFDTVDCSVETGKDLKCDPTCALCSEMQMHDGAVKQVV